MKNVTMIASIGKNLEIGKDNKLLWPIKEDLKFFKEQTMNKPIVMGINTFESMNRRQLPGRQSVILTRKDITLEKGIIILHSKEELLEYIDRYKDEVMIIGGATIYKEMLKYAEKLVLTEVDRTCSEADSYFPYFNKDEWNRVVLSELEENNIKYKHLIYTKKKS